MCFFLCEICVGLRHMCERLQKVMIEKVWHWKWTYPSGDIVLACAATSYNQNCESVRKRMSENIIDYLLA